MSKTRVSCFIRGSKHLETIKARGRRPSVVICFSVFGTPDETLPLVFDILPLNLKNEQSRIIGGNFWRHFRSQSWKDFDLSEAFFRRTKPIKWQHLQARLASKSRATTANSECRSLLPIFLVSCTVAFFDLLRSSAAKLAHLSLHYLIQFYLTLCLAQ